VTPAFLFLAAGGLAIGLAFTLFGVETHGRPLALEAAGQGTSSRSADGAGTVTVGLGRKSEAVAAHPTAS
jgi:MFS transporter, putative metabolite:H+ symporter